MVNRTRYSYGKLEDLMNQMTIFEAIEMVLNMAKAEYDNSIEQYRVPEPEKLKRMEDAITTVESWIADIRSGKVSKHE